MIPRSFAIIVLFFWFTVAAYAGNDTGNPYLAELIARAHAAHLAQRSEWHALLHYHPNTVRPGVTSQADDPAFFHAPNGKTDPAAELDGTLAAFFSDAQETDTKQNPQCAFIGRYQWLKSELHFDPARLPEQPCRRYKEWRAALDPRALTLIFPAAYLNNPSSMFGHTLLRVDGAGQTDQSRLLAYAINYAAATKETNGALFAVKGIFGGYPGLFSISPYYVKVKEYSDLENRDVWEYELNFTPEEIERVLMHAWELGPINFDYFFFDENCSYHLLSLLDVGRPGLDLTDEFKYWVIPSDTVRAIAARPGMVRRTVYRPAAGTRLKYRVHHMSDAEQHDVQALVDGKIDATSPSFAALPDAARADRLETAYEYLRYQVTTHKREAATAAALSRALLLARSRIDVPRQEPAVPVPAKRPEEGHPTARLALGYGALAKDRFYNLKWRPAYHDILDPDAGYTPGAQINFVDVDVRYWTASERLKLERLSLIDIVSLTPRDAFFRSLSWKVGTGVVRVRRPGDDEGLAYHVDGGPGLVFGNDNVFLYGFVDNDLRAGGALKKHYAYGFGPNLGALFMSEHYGKLNIFLRALHYPLGDEHHSRESGVQYRLPLGKRYAVDLKWSETRDYGVTRPLWRASLHWYF